MSRSIALLLCTTYTLILLRIEKKKNLGASLVLWLPTVWMVLIASKPLGVWFGAGALADEGSALDRVFLLCLLCVGLLVLIQRRFNWARAFRSNRYLLVLIGYMLVSILWSSIAFISFKRWTREVTAVVMAFVVLTEDDPRAAVLCLFRRLIVILIPFSLLLIKYYPEYGIEYGRWTGERMWIGVTLQKNGLGRLSLFAVFYYLWSFAGMVQREGHPARRLSVAADLSVLLIALYLLKATPGSYSATAIVSLAGGVTVFLLLLWARKVQVQPGPNLIAGLVVAVVFFAIVTVLVGGTTVASATSALGRNTTLTGRTDVWASLVSVFSQRPILGSGFGSFWTSGSRVSFDIPDAHSGYLDVLLELGLAGIVLLTAYLASLSRKAQRELTSHFQWASLCICYLVMTLIHNISESTINSFGSHLPATILFLSVCQAAPEQVLGAEVSRISVTDAG